MSAWLHLFLLVCLLFTFDFLCTCVLIAIYFYVSNMLSLRIPCFSPFRAAVCKWWIDVNLLLLNVEIWVWSWLHEVIFEDLFYTCRRVFLVFVTLIQHCWSLALSFYWGANLMAIESRLVARFWKLFNPSEIPSTDVLTLRRNARLG